MLEKEFVEKVHEALMVSQSRMLAHHYILAEVVINLARANSDPQQYLARMFERVSARMDQGPIEKEADPVTAETRSVIANFFSKAVQVL